MRRVPIGIAEGLQHDEASHEKLQLQNKSVGFKHFKTIDSGNGNIQVDNQILQYADIDEDPTNIEQRQRIFEDVIIQRMKVMQSFVKRNVDKMSKRITEISERKSSKEFSLEND